MAWSCENCKHRTACLASVLQKRATDTDKMEGFYTGGTFAFARCEDRETYQPPPKPPRTWVEGQTAVYQCIMRAEVPLTQIQIEELTGVSRNCATYYLQRLARGGYIHRRQDACRERRMYHWHSEIGDEHLPELMRHRWLLPQVVRMTQAGLSKQKISRALGIGETVVFSYRKEARILGLLED